MAKLTKDSFISSLKEMSILEIKELVDAMKDEFGIDPTAVAVAAGPAVDAAPTEVTVTLTAMGAKKVAVIKVVRALTGAGLMDAKKIVESAPVAIKENIKPEEAEEIKKQLVEAGAEVSIA